MALFLYQRPTDNVAPNATVTVDSGTGDPDYPPSYLTDLAPGRPAKLTTTSGRWVFDFGSAQRVDLAALIHHNLTGGLNVRLRGNATNAWGAPTLDIAFTVANAYLDNWRANPWIDVTATVPVAANRTFRYWAVDIVGVNGAAVQIGEVWLGAEKRAMLRGPNWGSDRGELRPMVRHETDYGVELLYDRGAKIRTVNLTAQVTDAELGNLKNVWDAARGASRPFLVVPADDADDAWFVRFNQDEWKYTRRTRNENELSLALREVGRGPYL
jgi:hypothetical protein